MTSDLQIASNRQNAQKSTGPRTVEGRARVACNGVTHGLTGRFHLLDGESLDHVQAKLTADHLPEGESEAFLVRQLAELQLRLDRAASLESELMLAVVDPGSPAASPNAILARTLLKDCTFDVALLRLNRYESSLRRSHLATLRELRQQQKNRHSQVPVVDQPSVADVMEDLVRELAKSHADMPAFAAPQPSGKANPVPTPATIPTIEIDPVNRDLVTDSRTVTSCPEPRP